MFPRKRPWSSIHLFAGNMDEAMHKAAREGDIDKVKQIIEGGVSVDSRDDVERTPLHCAAHHGRYEVAELLISNKCDLNIKDDWGRTPLHYAVFWERYEVAKLLISNKCDLNLKDDAEYTPLHWAAIRGWNEVVELLISNKCDLNLKDRYDRTAVMLAAISHKKDVVGLLLQHGAQLSCGDNHKYILLHWVSYHGWADFVRHILDSGEADPKAECTKGKTPLMLAAIEGHPEVASLLIRAGADVNRRDKRMVTALHMAAHLGCTGVIQVLLGVEGLELNPQDKDGSTPLHLACIGGEAQVVKQLLEAGANTIVKNYQNETALSEGIRKQKLNIEEIRLFVDHGVFLENSEYDGISANPVLRESVLRDVNLCTRSIVNKFNRQSLPTLYSIPYIARSLPPIEFLKLSDEQTLHVANFVANEIKAKSSCNVVAAQPKVLQVLCVLASITADRHKTCISQFL